ncbi:unnamed protein product [Prunus brigantina]
MGSLTSLPKDYQHTPTVNRPSRNPGEEDGKGGPDDRLVRIRNIFTLCGNYRERSQHVTSPAPTVASVKSENEQKLTEGINKSRVCDVMRWHWLPGRTTTLQMWSLMQILKCM